MIGKLYYYCSEPNKSKKKSKHDESDASDEEDGFKYEEDVKQVSYFQLFRYATNKDRGLYAIGLLSAVATGLTTPANSLIFGNLAGASESVSSSFIPQSFVGVEAI